LASRSGSGVFGVIAPVFSMSVPLGENRKNYEGLSSIVKLNTAGI
jgi:hypothetical protein